MLEKPLINQTSHILILDGRNYTLWNIMMDVELSGRGLCQVCHRDTPPSSDPSTLIEWNQADIEAVQLILSCLHQEIIISIVDALTVKSAKELWDKITMKFTSQTVTNRGQTWVCISLPPDIMVYSILGKISWDISQYDHIIDSMVLSINSNINPQQVLDKLPELLRHKNTKRDSQKTLIKEKNNSSALLTASNQFPYKLTYICKDGKHNIKNTTHKAENCWAEHP
ncbi:hypothetical protein O181_075451 [Austropuccinia psidii MF-1]|uniref:Retrotransposon Copia-like N-terminal domain-containing protein n=1 Tax=Austropuccinia psidii MF-1 TaxID=1389203 RepID=A0A9Q3IA72_9BASI|nr:hypothetical protein [Austropuccinia psidii MF-1]